MPSPAIAAALALASAPTLAAALRKRPLPDGVDELLCVFAGREDDILRLVGPLELDPLFFADCVDNYIQKVVLHPSGDPFRLLAGTPSSTRESLRHNMKLLLEGLHPDKLDGSWKSAYAPRVIEAWQAVSSGRAVSIPPPGPALRSARRQLAWIPHPVPASSAPRFSWRGRLALLAAGVALALAWLVFEPSLFAISESLSP